MASYGALLLTAGDVPYYSSKLAIGAIYCSMMYYLSLPIPKTVGQSFLSKSRSLALSPSSLTIVREGWAIQKHFALCRWIEIDICFTKGEGWTSLDNEEVDPQSPRWGIVIETRKAKGCRKVSKAEVLRKVMGHDGAKMFCKMLNPFNSVFWDRRESERPPPPQHFNYSRGTTPSPLE
jgi:hypothetical protein